MKFIKLFGIFVLTLVLLYVVGPSPETPEYSNELPIIGTPLADIEDSLVLFESENNVESCAFTEIQWADSIRQTSKVSYSGVGGIEGKKNNKSIGNTGNPSLSPSLLLNLPGPSGFNNKGRCANAGQLHPNAS
jgi:hypothetical protein